MPFPYHNDLEIHDLHLKVEFCPSPRRPGYTTFEIDSPNNLGEIVCQHVTVSTLVHKYEIQDGEIRTDTCLSLTQRVLCTKYQVGLIISKKISGNGMWPFYPQ